MFANNCQIVQMHTMKGKGMLSEIYGVRQTSAKKRERFVEHWTSHQSPLQLEIEETQVT
jgi:hypothetical protein